MDDMLATLKYVIFSVQRHWVASGVTALVTIAVLGSSSTAQLMAQKHCAEKYSLVNPIWRCRDEVLQKREYEAFKDELAAKLETVKKDKDIEVALYFRDLQSGPWFGINENTEFFPVSLTKLPTMLAILKIADREPEVLETHIGLEDAPPVEPSIDPADIDKTLIVGENYTVEEVLRRMIVYSDNMSDFLLRMYLGQVLHSDDFLLHLFREIGIAGEDEKELTLSVKEYSSLFRMLYNRQFLSPKMSQKALELLAESEYTAGLRAQLPPEIRVAHKFGYYDGGKEHKDLLQLHDCGIVYHPNTRYTLCIMTRGKDLQAMTSLISDLSKSVYDEVTAASHSL